MTLLSDLVTWTLAGADAHVRIISDWCGEESTVPSVCGDAFHARGHQASLPRELCPAWTPVSSWRREWGRPVNRSEGRKDSERRTGQKVQKERAEIRGNSGGGEEGVKSKRMRRNRSALS